jgi:hypothetical protein
MKSLAMRTPSRILLSLGAAATLVMVVSCSSGNTGSPGVRFSQVKDGSHGDVAPMQPYWKSSSSSTVYLYLYGSSSCSPKVEQVKQKNATLQVKLHKYTGACTADYGGPYIWKVDGLQKKTQKVVLSTGLNGKGEALKRRT